MNLHQMLISIMLGVKKKTQYTHTRTHTEHTQTQRHTHTYMYAFTQIDTQLLNLLIAVPAATLKRKTLKINLAEHTKKKSV